MKKTLPSGSRTAGAISPMLIGTGGGTVVSLRLRRANGWGGADAPTQVSVVGAYFSENGGEVMVTVRTVPSGSSTQLSSSLPVDFVGGTVPKAVPASVQVPKTGSQIAV